MKVVAVEFVAVSLHHVEDMARIRSILVLNVLDPGEAGDSCNATLLEILGPARLTDQMTYWCFRSGWA